MRSAEVKEFSDQERRALERLHALHRKYDRAVALYADTELPLCEIARRCGVSVGGFGSYLRRYWRELMLRRQGISCEGKDPQEVKVVSPEHAHVVSYARYREAVEACGSLAYIAFNVSQVARKFHVDEAGLANYMRVHDEEIPLWREKVREALGISDHVHRGVRPACRKQYAPAVEMYGTTEKTLPEVAGSCQVSVGGLDQHLRCYHKEVIRKRKAERKAARSLKVVGKRTGNGQIHRPLPETVEKYRATLELYQNSSLTVREITCQTGVPEGGFRAYLRIWHRDLMRERRGGARSQDGCMDPARTKCYLKSVGAKYEAAISSLKENLRPVTRVAAEFGLHADTFRSYLWEHEPELVARLGRARNEAGKCVSRQAAEKYAEAVRLYETTAEDLKSIARRLGVVYNSLGGYIRRSCPEARLKHDRVVRHEREGRDHLR